MDWWFVYMPIVKDTIMMIILLSIFDLLVNTFFPHFKQFVIRLWVFVTIHILHTTITIAIVGGIVIAGNMLQLLIVFQHIVIITSIINPNPLAKIIFGH